MAREFVVKKAVVRDDGALEATVALEDFENVTEPDGDGGDRTVRKVAHGVGGSVVCKDQHSHSMVCVKAAAAKRVHQCALPHVHQEGVCHPKDRLYTLKEHLEQLHEARAMRADPTDITPSDQKIDL